MIGRIITRGRNSGLKCLSKGSLPLFPSLSSLFFPQTESLFTGYVLGRVAKNILRLRELVTIISKQ